MRAANETKHIKYVEEIIKKHKLETTYDGNTDLVQLEVPDGLEQVIENELDEKEIWYDIDFSSGIWYFTIHNYTI
jgi:hypothetical protein